MKPKAIYRIDGLQRRSRGFHACGFAIYLDPGFARAAINHRLGHDMQARLIDQVRDLIGYEYARVVFHEDTAFIRSLSVEGDCACLGIDGMLFEGLIGEGGWDGVRKVDFHTHNVDTRQQAFDLLSVFTYWVDLVEALAEGAGAEEAIPCSP